MLLPCYENEASVNDISVLKRVHDRSFACVSLLTICKFCDGPKLVGVLGQAKLILSFDVSKEWTWCAILLVYWYCFEPFVFCCKFVKAIG